MAGGARADLDALGGSGGVKVHEGSVFVARTSDFSDKPARPRTIKPVTFGGDSWAHALDPYPFSVYTCCRS